MSAFPSESLPGPSPEGSQSIPELLARRQELTRLLDETDDAFDACTAEEVAACDQLLEQYTDEGLGEIAVLITYGKGVLSADFYDMLQTTQWQYRQLEAVESQLDAVAGAEFARYIKQEADRLLAMLAISRLEDTSYSDEDKNAVYEAIYALKLIRDSTSTSFSVAEIGHDSLERSRAVLEDLNMLRVASVQAPDVAEQPLYDIAELHRAYELNNRYRNYHNELYPDAAQSKAVLPTHHWQVTVDDERRSALVRHLHSLDVEKEIDRLRIEGLDQLPFNYTTSQLLEVLHKVPAIAFEGVESLVFKYSGEISGSKATSELGEGWAEVAHHAHSLEQNQAQIVIWLDPLKHQLESGDENLLISALWPEAAHRQRNATAEAERELEASILHEFGHAFHHALPVSLLREWDEVARQGDSNPPVSQYVGRMRAIGHDHYAPEDFADSFKLSMTAPLVLRYLDAKRFAAMERVIQSCQPRANARAFVDVK